MRRSGGILVAAFALAAGLGAYGELENVEVSGSLRVRYRHWDNVYGPSDTPPGQIRIPAGFLPGRPIGPWGATSRYTFDDEGAKLDYTEHNVRLNFKATMTNDVSAFVQLFQTNRWGRNEFRSNYQTGFDSYSLVNRDVQLMQSYIEMTDVYGLPLDVKIGRQHLTLGGGWLISSYSGYLDRAFDGVRATWKGNGWGLDAFYTILGENGPIEEDEDVTFAGLHGRWEAAPALTIEPYWYWLRDPISVNDTNFTAPVEWLETAFGLDDYDPVNIHTTGLIVSGEAGPWDYEAQGAYQFGEAGAIGSMFSGFGTYGDDGAEYDAWGMDATLGYSFETKFSPRVFANFVYMSGEDNRDISFAEWLNPFDNHAKASLSFNRLFSGTTYMFIWDRNKNLSNFRRIALGAEFQFTDKISGDIAIGRYWANETFDRPRSFAFGGFQVPIAPALSFWTEESSDDMGYGLQTWLRYDYSEDLYFRVGYEYLFAGEGLSDGNFQDRNGLELVGGSDDDDASYLILEVVTQF